MIPNWPAPFSPEDYAIALMRQKFGGPVPEMISRAECLTLMLKFAEFESDRAEAVLDLLTRTCILNPHTDVG